MTITLYDCATALLWRMRQFFVTYRDFPKLSTLLRVLPWSSHLHILSRSKRPEEREFYRTRLVADVVTGKLDVREAAARLPEAEDAAFSESGTDSTEENDAALMEAEA